MTEGGVCGGAKRENRASLRALGGSADRDGLAHAHDYVTLGVAIVQAILLHLMKKRQRDNSLRCGWLSFIPAARLCLTLPVHAAQLNDHLRVEADGIKYVSVDGDLAYQLKGFELASACCLLS